MEIVGYIVEGLCYLHLIGLGALWIAEGLHNLRSMS